MSAGVMNKLDKAQRNRALELGDRLGLSDPIAYELIWLRDTNANLLAALQPFAEWARGLAEVEQNDAFEYQRLKRPAGNGVTICEVTALDFANVLEAVAKAKAR